MNQKHARLPKVALKDDNLRNFSVEFKKSKVKELSKGIITIKQVCALYNVSRTSVYKWIHLYSETPFGVKTVVQMDSEQAKTLSCLNRISELERIVGQKQLEIDYLNKLLELVGCEFNMDLKKKGEQLRLNGLGGAKKA